jgi:asparagine synthase (glutamine-hydrolysing)
VVTCSAEGGLLDPPLDLHAADDRHAVVFGGRLFERAELERELGLQQHPGRTDAAIVLAAFDRWGADTPCHIKGEFSFVAWSRDERRLYGVRDPLGTQPLFRVDTGQGFLFSNSTRALASSGLVATRADSAALVGLLASRLVDQEQTFLAAVRRVPQGHIWSIGLGGSTLRRYWDPAPEGQPFVWASDEELEQFDQLLERAVTRRLAPGATGIFLSGGLDSVTIAAFATDIEQRSEQAPWAFSLIFPEGEANEEEIQRGVASALDLQQLTLPLEEAVGPDGVMAASLELAARWPMPLLNYWLPAYLRLNEGAVERGCDVILSGGGGDEWLTAGPFYAADLIRSLRLRELAAFTAAYRRSYPVSGRRLTMNLLWRFGMRQLLVDAARPPLERYGRPLLSARLNRILPLWLAPDLGLRRDLRERSMAPRRSSGRTVYDREARSALEHPLMDMDMEELFENGAYSGLSMRQPFWDADLLKLLYRVHPKDLNRGGYSKGLVRDALDRRFPEGGFRRQRKVAATTYLQDLVLREGPAASRRLGQITALGDLGVVDPVRLQAEIDRALTHGDRSQTHTIWAILILEAWARTHA